MTLYEKRGRRYVPVRDTDAYEGLPAGYWLVIVEPGHQSIRRLVDADHAGFLAAARAAEQAMLEAARRASESRPHRQTLSPREKKAYQAWADIMGEQDLWLTLPAAGDIVDAALEAARQEYEKQRGKT